MTPTSPHRANSRRRRRVVGVLASGLALPLATTLWGPPAAQADTLLSPTTVEAGEAATFTIRVTDARGVDLVARVTADHPADWSYGACRAPDGWSCDGGGGAVVWQRESSLSLEETFTFALVAPDEAGEATFTVTDQRASGAASSRSTSVTVTAPQGQPSEEPDEATEEPTEEPTPQEQPPPTAPDREEPPLAPFRPPSEDGPISIRELPEVPEPGATATGAPDPSGSGGGAGDLVVLLLGPLVGLLLLSAAGFALAHANR